MQSSSINYGIFFFDSLTSIGTIGRTGYIPYTDHPSCAGRQVLFYANLFHLVYLFFRFLLSNPCAAWCNSDEMEEEHYISKYAYIPLQYAR